MYVVQEEELVQLECMLFNESLFQALPGFLQSILGSANRDPGYRKGLSRLAVGILKPCPIDLRS